MRYLVIVEMLDEDGVPERVESMVFCGSEDGAKHQKDFYEVAYRKLGLDVRVIIFDQDQVVAALKEAYGNEW